MEKRIMEFYKFFFFFVLAYYINFTSMFNYVHIQKFCYTIYKGKLHVANFEKKYQNKQLKV